MILLEELASSTSDERYHWVAKIILDYVLARKPIGHPGEDKLMEIVTLGGTLKA